MDKSVVSWKGTLEDVLEVCAERIFLPALTAGDGSRLAEPLEWRVRISSPLLGASVVKLFTDERFQKTFLPAAAKRGDLLCDSADPQAARIREGGQA